MHPGYLLTIAAVAAAGTIAAARTDGDERAIRRHIERYYFEGVRNSDTAAAHKAFHPVAVMYSVRDGELAERKIPDWLVRIAERAPNPPKPDTAPRRVMLVDVAGTAAVAKVRIEYPDATVTDYMTLLKLGGEWTIVGKIFNWETISTQAAGR